MHKRNEGHRQSSFFEFSLSLSPDKQKKLAQTPEASFYQQIFCRIDERSFAVLYSEKASRPCSPINVIIGALIFKESKPWSYDTLFEQMEFDLRTRTAFGLHDLNQKFFCQATIFNFQNRINKSVTLNKHWSITRTLLRSKMKSIMKPFSKES